MRTESISKFQIKTAGGFTFAANQSSIRVMEKNGFQLKERFVEDGVESCYLQWERGGNPSRQKEEKSDYEREQIR